MAATASPQHDAGGHGRRGREMVDEVQRHAAEREARAAEPREQRVEARVGGDHRGERRGASRPRPVSAAPPPSDRTAAATRWRQERFSAPPPAPPRSSCSATQGAPRAARSVRSIERSVQRLRCVPRTAGSSTIRRPAAYSRMPSSMSSIDGPRVALRVEAADGVEGLAADRAEAGPERRRRTGRARVHVVVQEVAKARDVRVAAGRSS